MDAVTKDVVIQRIDSLSKIDLIDLFAEAVKELKERNLTLQRYKDQNEHKVDFYDAVTSSTNLIDMSEVAKVSNVPKMGRNKLFEFLRKKNILRSNNQPYQEYVDRGYFKLLEQHVSMPYGESMINCKTVVTQKGLDFIRRKLNEHFARH